MEKPKIGEQKSLNRKFDDHLYRRVFHTFAASFLIYYSLPNEQWINTLKFYIPIIIVVFALTLEYLRLKGRIDHIPFFRLRSYEEKRPAGYLYFGVAVLILLLFFPQQIAIPCILCACFSDPIIGEIRYHLARKKAYVIGFFICMFFFLITWFKADIWIVLLVSIIGGTGALIGEVKKFWLIDDDFMIQILPAILIFILWQGLKVTGFDILPAEIILPV